MAERIQLNEEQVESVVGGYFTYNTYTNDDGSEYMTCRVDEIGTYKCTDNAKRMISRFFMNNWDATAQDAVNYALANGYFSEL